MTAHLFEIDPAVPYELTESMTYEPGPSVRVMGAKLRAWKIGLDQCPGSIVIEYRAVRRK